MVLKNNIFLVSLFLFLFSLSAFLALNLINLKKSNVLGDTTSYGVPCSLIDSWQKNYCSSTTISPPVTTTTPTPTICKTGINTLSFGPVCSVNGEKGSQSLSFTCYGGYSSIIYANDSCSTQGELKILAEKVCQTHSSCNQPTPTRYPTPTPTVKPPIQISSYPTPTPASSSCSDDIRKICETAVPASDRCSTPYKKDCHWNGGVLQTVQCLSYSSQCNSCGIYFWKIINPLQCDLSSGIPTPTPHL